MTCPACWGFSSSLLLHRIVLGLIKRLKTAQPSAGRDCSSQGTLSWRLLIQKMDNLENQCS